MKLIYETYKSWNYKLLFNCFILGLLVLSCTCERLQIQYLPFFDSHSNTYRIVDTAQVHPQPDKSMYYSINQSSLRCININELDSVVNSNSEIQKQLKRNYYRVNVILYKESDNLKEAIKHQSHKLLTLCNDDIVAEYMWEKGELVTALYYEDGQIKGSGNIKLEDVPEEDKN